MYSFTLLFCKFSGHFAPDFGLAVVFFRYFPLFSDIFRYFTIISGTADRRDAGFTFYSLFYTANCPRLRYSRQKPEKQR